MSKKRALITGIAGQDGSFPSELLLNKGYEVHGIAQKEEYEHPEKYFWRLKDILSNLIIHPTGLKDYRDTLGLLNELKPDECYHLAAQSFVSYSIEDEFKTLDSNINGTLQILSALREKSPGTRLYFAGSSEMY